MIRFFLLLLSTALLLMLGWGALVIVATLDGWTREPIAPPGDAQAFATAAIREIDSSANGNVVFALIENGEAVAEYQTSVGAPVNRDSLFQVASVSKWISAWGVMTLVDAGSLDLDAPVGDYLQRWQLPDSGFDNAGVTARRLLSHTAGLTDGLGYGGFPPGAEIPSLEASLTRAVDASPGADGRVRVGVEPGSRFLYSGGGYSLLQLLIEEISGLPFETYMQQAVLDPLGMQHSTFAPDPATADLAEIFDTDGTAAIRFGFAGLAAAGLNTSAADMVTFLLAQLPGPQGEPIGRGVLRPDTLAEMRTPHAQQFGGDIWGLGTMLYAPAAEGGFIVGHDGNNEPAINAAVRLNPATGDGIVVLESGNSLLATTLAGEWVFWQAGTLDVLMVTLVFDAMAAQVLAGWLVIFAVAVYIGWRRFSASRR